MESIVGNTTSSSMQYISIAAHFYEQFQILAEILFTAAKQEGLVDPHKIETVLKVPNSKNSAASRGKTVIEEIITGSCRLLLFTSDI